MSLQTLFDKSFNHNRSPSGRLFAETVQEKKSLYLSRLSFIAGKYSHIYICFCLQFLQPSNTTTSHLHCPTSESTAFKHLCGMLQPLSYFNIDINLFPTPEITESFKDKPNIKIFPENVPSVLSMKNKNCIWAFFVPYCFTWFRKQPPTSSGNQSRTSV